MAEEKTKEVTYVTQYKGLELVHTPMGLKDQQGNKRPSVRCAFMPTAYGYAFSTSNKELIEWLATHEYTLAGKIAQLDDAAKKAATPPEAPGVSRNGVTTESGKSQEAEAPAPEERQRTEPHQARVRK